MPLDSRLYAPLAAAAIRWCGVPMARVEAAAAAIICGLVGGSAVHAQVADLTRASCAHLMDLPANDRGQLIVWLHGYYAGAAQRAMLDRTRLENAVAAIQQLCERNRNLPLIGSEARSLFLGEAPPMQPPSSAAPLPGAERVPAGPSSRSPLP